MRFALGATRGEILRLVLADGLRLTIIGVDLVSVVGGVAAMSRLLFGVQTLDSERLQHRRRDVDHLCFDCQLCTRQTGFAGRSNRWLAARMIRPYIPAAFSVRSVTGEADDAPSAGLTRPRTKAISSDVPGFWLRHDGKRRASTPLGGTRPKRNQRRF